MLECASKSLYRGKNSLILLQNSQLVYVVGKKMVKEGNMEITMIKDVNIEFTSHIDLGGRSIEFYGKAV